MKMKTRKYLDLVGDSKVAKDVSSDDPCRFTLRGVRRMGGEDCIAVVFFAVSRDEPDKPLGVDETYKREKNLDREETHFA